MKKRIIIFIMLIALASAVLQKILSSIIEDSIIDFKAIALKLILVFLLIFSARYQFK